MKLKEISKEIEKEVYDGPGTYAGVRFSPTTVNALRQYGKDNNIPNRISGEKMHTTLLYSRKPLPNYEPAGKYPRPLKGVVTGFEIWPSQPDKETGKVKNCLVMAYSCPDLYRLHHKLMNKHGATYDFDEYKPHVTISYDIGDIDIEKLPQIDIDIDIVEEYREDLSETWASDQDKKKKEEK